MEENNRILQASAGHAIIVVGGNLISDKMFNIISMALTSPDLFGPYTINKITFSENQPEGKFGQYSVEEGEIIINLQRHFDAACKSIQQEEDVIAKNLSFRANLWYDLLFTIIHEATHAVAWAVDADSVKEKRATEQGKKDLEDDCNELAKETLVDLFRDYDCEPATIAEEPFFGARFMQFFIQNIKDKDADWAIRQSIMIDSDFIHYDENVNAGLKTMKEWLRLTIPEEDAKHENWDKKGEMVPNAVVNPAVMVVGAETAEEQAVTTAVQTKEEAPLPMVQEQKVEAQPTPLAEEHSPKPIINDPFAQASDDAVMNEIANSVGHIGTGDLGEGAEESFEGYAQAEMQTQVAEEVKPVEHKVEEPVITKCSNCQNDLPAKAQFCMFCGAKVGQTTACVFGKENVNLNAFPGPGSQAVADTATQFVGGPTTPAQTTGVTGQQQTFPKQVLRTNLANHNMSLVDMQRILEEVYRRMHEHVFSKCGFQVCGVGTGADKGFNPNFVGNVLEPIPIGDIPGANKLIIGFDKKNTQSGRLMKNTAITDGTISGWCTKDKNLPTYAIYINNNGTECRRQFMVQNPFKIQYGGSDYTAPAKRAQQGNQISWVWDGQDGLTRRVYLYKTENGVAEWLR